MEGLVPVVVVHLLLLGLGNAALLLLLALLCVLGRESEIELAGLDLFVGLWAKIDEVGVEMFRNLRVPGLVLRMDGSSSFFQLPYLLCLGHGDKVLSLLVLLLALAHVLHGCLRPIRDIIHIDFWTVHFPTVNLGICKVLGARSILALVSLLLLRHCRAALAGGDAADDRDLDWALGSLGSK